MKHVRQELMSVLNVWHIVCIYSIHVFKGVFLMDQVIKCSVSDRAVNQCPAGGSRRFRCSGSVSFIWRRQGVNIHIDTFVELQIVYISSCLLL